MKARGARFGFDFRVVFIVSVSVLGFIACARTDFQAFDEFDEAAGESGTGTGGRPNGGTSSGGFSGTGFTGGFSGTGFTGGVSGTGGGVCRDGRDLCGNECVLTDRDPRHCGECFYACDGNEACVRGGCIPLCESSSSTYCDGICTDISRDPLNCGGCGYVCAEGLGCRFGYCTSLCGEDSILCDGVCVDWTSDPMNCGGCGISCGRGMSPNACVGGVCRCPGNQVDCGTGCTNLSEDPRNCGRCGFACAEGQFCANDTCQFECPPNLTLCDGRCTNVESDRNNCGSCGLECGSRWYCSSGNCTPFPDTVTYTVSTSPLPFVSACGQPGSSQFLGNTDDSATTLMLPFQFHFYGLTAVVAWASSNGIVGFGQATTDFENECSGSIVRLAVIPFWDDLATRQPGVCMATLGASPNRQFVVTWNDAYVLGFPETHLNFSVVLNESTGVIDVLYGTMTGSGTVSAGQGATIGLASEQAYSLDCCDQPCVTSNTGRRYTPVLP